MLGMSHYPPPQTGLSPLLAARIPTFPTPSGCQVRLVMLQAIGKLLEAGYLERVEGWPLSYVSLQLAISAHRLVRIPPCSGRGLKGRGCCSAGRASVQQAEVPSLLQSWEMCCLPEPMALPGLVT